MFIDSSPERPESKTTESNRAPRNTQPTFLHLRILILIIHLFISIYLLSITYLHTACTSIHRHTLTRYYKYQKDSRRDSLRLLRGFYPSVLHYSSAIPNPIVARLQGIVPDCSIDGKGEPRGLEENRVNFRTGRRELFERVNPWTKRGNCSSIVHS